MDPSDVDPVIPDYSKCSLTEDQERFVLKRAGELNFLIDQLGMAKAIGGTEIFGKAIAQMFAYAFNSGVEFAKEK